MKSLRYFLEAVFLFVVLAVFRALPAQTASNIGGFIGRTAGPRLAASRKARRNLEKALPGMAPEKAEAVITGMWDNLGRIIAEYPHLKTLGRDYTTIEGADILADAIKAGKGAVCFGAHVGNWEIPSVAGLFQGGPRFDISYRAPNNPYIDRLLVRARSFGGRIKAYAKSRSGGMRMMEAIKNGEALGILIDQKYSQGLAIAFFGREAMTNPFFVQLAQKYKCPLIPFRNIRLDGARFKILFYEPLRLFEEDGTPRPAPEVIAEAHAILEGWITEKPEQWLWLHRRWKED